MPYIKTKDGTDLYVKDWGQGRPVILTHGWPLSADSWDDLATVLATSGYRAIFYDRRGFGRSGQPFAGYDYDTFADDLADVIDATGATDATIMGFSMGGGEIARYASRHSNRNVVQAGLISAVVPYIPKTDDNPHGVDQATLKSIVDGIKADRPHFMAGFLQDFYGVGYISSPVSQETLDWSLGMVMQSGLHPTLAAAAAWSLTDFRPDLPAINVPTLIIHGTSDKTVPIDATARPAAQAISQSTLIEYDGAPHGLTVTEKDRLAADILQFLGR